MEPFAARHAPTTAVEAIARTIALAILRGEHAPGANLPSLRDLAEAHAVTLPTVQRVVARLEAQGLVTARHGSGVRVLDPARHAELSLTPLWFEALPPPEAAALLSDLLAVRRVVAGHLVAGARDAVAAALPTLAALLADLLGTVDIARRAERDLAFTATFVEATGNRAVRAVFRSIERLVLEVPWAAEAFYARWEAHDAALQAMAQALVAPDPAAAIDAALAPWDAAAVTRYQRLVEDAAARETDYSS